MSGKKELEVVEASPVTPMDLIERASASGASIEQMQQLFELKIRVEENEARKAYNEAMSRFRASCPAIGRTRTGHNCKYSGLSETMDIVNPLLAENGLSVKWKTSQREKDISVECIVTHAMGHSESTSLTAAPDTSGSKNSIQAIGSTVAYLERYTMFAMLGLSSREMDNDANIDDVEYISETQVYNLEGLLAKTKFKEEAFLKRFKIDDFAKMPVEQYDYAIRKLKESLEGGDK